jgi:hypothetical protein|eukprot:SAG25_NODE_101_length_15508_cov_11.653384_16_plen_465_part_00
MERVDVRLGQLRLGGTVRAGALKAAATSSRGERWTRLRGTVSAVGQLGRRSPDSQRAQSPPLSPRAAARAGGRPHSARTRSRPPTARRPRTARVVRTRVPPSATISSAPRWPAARRLPAFLRTDFGDMESAKAPCGLSERVAASLPREMLWRLHRSAIADAQLQAANERTNREHARHEQPRLRHPELRAAYDPSFVDVYAEQGSDQSTVGDNAVGAADSVSSSSPSPPSAGSASTSAASLVHDRVGKQRLRNQQRKLEAGTRTVERCLHPILQLIQDTQHVVLKRDAAAALYSLSFNPKNVQAFAATSAIAVLVRLCGSASHAGIRREVLGALFRLSLSRRAKRQLVRDGCVAAVLPFCRNTPRFAALSAGDVTRDSVGKLATGIIRELAELPSNRCDSAYTPRRNGGRQSPNRACLACTGAGGDDVDGQDGRHYGYVGKSQSVLIMNVPVISIPTCMDDMTAR